RFKRPSSRPGPAPKFFSPRRVCLPMCSTERITEPALRRVRANRSEHLVADRMRSMNERDPFLAQLERARSASRTLAHATTSEKNAALEGIAAAIEHNVSQIVEANARDLEAG